MNDTSNYWELHLPFGGRAGRASGRGRLGGRHTLEEFTEIKTISFDVELSSASASFADNPSEAERAARTPAKHAQARYAGSPAQAEQQR